MGIFSFFFKKMKPGKKKAHILIVGLDSSGKSTIIEQLKPAKLQSPEIAPTVGFNVEEFEKSGVNFTVFDMSGAGRYRNLWEKYYRDAEAVIFVVDSADKIRMCVVKDELDSMLSNVELRSVPLLIFANKMDIPTSLSAVDIGSVLRIEDIKDRPINILPSNALTGEGLEKGIDWLADKMRM